MHDLRYALRTLRRNPGFTAVAVFTLALGIGATTAIFSVVNGVLLRPLPYENPGRLVTIDIGYKGELLQFRQRAETFQQIESYRDNSQFTLTGEGEATRLAGSYVTTGLFSMLGVRAVLGRTFRRAEGRPGASPVVVLSYGLWQQRFGGDPDILGRELRLDRQYRTVVGVMPPDVRLPSRATQIWVPLVIDPGDPINLWAITAGNVVARLRPDVTRERARAEVSALAPDMRELFPWNMPADWRENATAVPLREEIVGDVGPKLLILLGATLFVLLIACVNVANLLLSRASGRRREFAMRAALGAGRGRLLRQLLTESALLGLVGGALGVLLAIGGVELLTAGLPADTPRLAQIGVDTRVLGFAALLALLAAVLFGLLPALRASRLDAGGALKEGGRGARSAPGRRRLAGALVAGEVALAIVLVIGAALLIKSIWGLTQVDPGFRAENLVTATVAPPEFRYRDNAARRNFYRALLRRAEALPGVRGIAVATGIPFGKVAHGSVFKIEGRPDPATTGDWPLAESRITISRNYLRTMGVPILRGRGFRETDRADAPAVVLINRALARRYWPDENPLGQRIRGPGSAAAWKTIVGVVGTVKRNRLTRDTETGDFDGVGAFYVPLAQGRTGAMSVVLRTTGDLQTAAGSLRGVVRSIDVDTPVANVSTMDRLLSAALADRRVIMLLLTAFAALALVLGAVGIYGVLAYAVGRRSHEIGLRMALGARSGNVLRLVVGRGITLALVGAIFGLIAAYWLTRLLSTMLYDVSATDPLVFAGVAALVTGIAVLASYIPARRATRVDPMLTLREE